MPEELTAAQAAARLETKGSLGVPLGPGQPPAFLRALGEREDWTDLRVYPVRGDPAGGHRLDPQPDRDATGGG
jgi:hypothetical protein